jgi:MFS family permease
MLALQSTAWVVPGLVGPGVAGLMAEALGWRSVFLALAPLPPLALLLAFPALRRMPAGTPSPLGRVRVTSAVVLAIGSGLLLTGISQPQPALVLALSVAGLALAIPAMRRLLPRGTLRALPGMPAIVATMGLLNLAFFGVDAFVPLALVDVRGTSVAYAGLALTAATITWTAGSWIQARTAPRVSRRLMIRLGLVVLGISFIITAAVLFPAVPLVLGVVGWGVAGLGMGLGYTTLSLAMLEVAEPGQEGDASASLQLASVLGSGLGAGVGGALIATMHLQGDTLTRALLWQDILMLAVVALGLVAARGVPARTSRMPGDS